MKDNINKYPLRFVLQFAFIVHASIGNASDFNSFFPLMAWGTTSSNAAEFQKMRECGLTVAGFVAPKDLDVCHAAGLKAIVLDSRVCGYDFRNLDAAVARKNVAELVAETGRHPAVYGYYLQDEPGADLFAGLAAASSIVKELAPGKWPYINLYPKGFTLQQLGATNYETYLESYIATCKPAQLSYDFYALMENGSTRDGYFLNLEQMSRAAKQHSLPFWNIVLATGHFSYREVSSADLRFQVYTTLAYGGRGIAYFTYFAPKVGNYRMAPIDQFGNQTSTWYSLQNVNLQVGKLAPTLLQLTWNDAYHFGTVLEGAHAPNESSLVTAVGNAPFMVGDYTHADGSRYVLIVNKDLCKSHACEITFRKTPNSVQAVSPYTGQLVTFADEEKWLAAGQGVLLKLD